MKKKNSESTLLDQSRILIIALLLKHNDINDINIQVNFLSLYVKIRKILKYKIFYTLICARTGVDSKRKGLKILAIGEISKRGSEQRSSQ